MKIIKRNGAEVPFDITKIITAVTKASDSVGGKARLSREQITDIAAAVTDQCQACLLYTSRIPISQGWYPNGHSATAKAIVSLCPIYPVHATSKPNIRLQ